MNDLLGYEFLRNPWRRPVLRRTGGRLHVPVCSGKLRSRPLACWRHSVWSCSRFWQNRLEYLQERIKPNDSSSRPVCGARFSVMPHTFANAKGVDTVWRPFCPPADAGGSMMRRSGWFPLPEPSGGGHGGQWRSKPPASAGGSQGWRGAVVLSSFSVHRSKSMWHCRFRVRPIGVT